LLTPPCVNSARQTGFFYYSFMTTANALIRRGNIPDTETR
jgi:hypothetical protein